jgi:hypothetical protein
MNRDPDRLIDQALSLLRNAMVESKTVLPVNKLRPEERGAISSHSQEAPLQGHVISKTVVAFAEPNKSAKPPVAEKDVRSTEPQVQEPQVQGTQVQEKPTASLIDQTLSMVAIAVSSEASSLQPTAKGIVAAEPPDTKAPDSFQEPEVALQQDLPEKPALEPWLDTERAYRRKRVQTFKANQQRFQREREEYYAATMAKIRASAPEAESGILFDLPTALRSVNANSV